MGFALHINCILRQDIKSKLNKGNVNKFEKDEPTILFDDIPIWLTKKDCTPLAEIKIISQKREGGRTQGKYKVLHVYKGEEQVILGNIFRRMYGWK